jgi:hypothetical protein
MSDISQVDLSFRRMRGLLLDLSKEVPISLFSVSKSGQRIQMPIEELNPSSSSVSVCMKSVHGYDQLYAVNSLFSGQPSTSNFFYMIDRAFRQVHIQLDMCSLCACVFMCMCVYVYVQVSPELFSRHLGADVSEYARWKHLIKPNEPIARRTRSAASNVSHSSE